MSINPTNNPQQGLMATLGPSLVNNNSADGFTRQKALSTTLQARIWWYKSRFNSDIDRASYEAYCASHPSSSPDASILAKLDEIQQRMGGGAPGSSSSSTSAAASPNIPAWQLNAPKVDLSKKADDGASHTNTGDGAPYPENFQALIEAVTLGKPIPGIKEIPDTVVRPPVSSSLQGPTPCALSPSLPTLFLSARKTRDLTSWRCAKKNRESPPSAR